MSGGSGVAEAVLTEEYLVAQVTQRVLESGLSNGTPASTVEALATTVVQELWPSPVKSFILVLATREVQDVLRRHGAAQDCAASQRPGPEYNSSPAAERPDLVSRDH